MFFSLAHVNVQSCIIEFSKAGFYLAQKVWERYSWTNGLPWHPKEGVGARGECAQGARAEVDSSIPKST